MEKIAVLYHASQVVLSTFDLDEVLVQILNIVREQFHVTHAAVLLLDETTSELYVRQRIGTESVKGLGFIALGQGITGSAAGRREAVYSADVRSDPRYIEGYSSTQSELALPLMIRDELVGVLDVQSSSLDAFDEDTIHLLTMFSMQASIAIENARLYSLVTRRATQLEAINAIARQTTSLLDLDKLLPNLCFLVLEKFTVSHIAVYLTDGLELRVRAQTGSLGPEFARYVSVGDRQSLVAKAYETGEMLLENDLRSLDDVESIPNDAASELCLPLIFFGEKLGVLVLTSDRAGAFTSSELDPLTAVADIFAGAIKNCQQFESAKQLAYRDGLTGVFNRRYFDERIQEELDRVSRYSEEFALLMIDIDEFKSVNDRFGHLPGDNVLRQIANLLSEQLRRSDRICRYGGEEFVVILPQLGRAHAVEVAEKLRRTIHASVLADITSLVSVSIGVAHAPIHGRSRDEIVAAADQALYAAKQSGRNRVVLAAEPQQALSTSV